MLPFKKDKAIPILICKLFFSSTRSCLATYDLFFFFFILIITVRIFTLDVNTVRDVELGCLGINMRGGKMLEVFVRERLKILLQYCNIK